MKNTLIIRDKSIRDNAAKMVQYIPIDPLHEVIIREHKKERSIAQNSLMWMWITLIAGERGETKNDIHFECKKNHLVKIYERDDADYAKMIESVRVVHKAGMVDEARNLADQIVELTSTTKSNVKQFTEYLNDIEKDAIGKGIPLPHPEDRYYIAMGIKR